MNKNIWVFILNTVITILNALITYLTHQTMWKKVPLNTTMARGFSASCQVLETSTSDQGVKTVSLVTKSVVDKYPELPDSSNYSLEAQLKSGVRLEDVNSKVLSPELPDNLPTFETTVVEEETE